jgi:ATP-dependent protease ClpP protease subunit
LSTEIMIYGIIGADVTSQQITNQLAEVEGDVVVRINSRGGDVFDGLAILNALRGHDGQVTTIVDGLAASAASQLRTNGAQRSRHRHGWR